jgi:hypothetical protein
MKLFRFALNIWITIASVLSFLLGWVALAHSPKPVQHTQVQFVSPAPVALPTLTPLQDLQSSGNTSNSFQTFQVQPPSSFFNSAPAPVFRSSGS